MIKVVSQYVVYTNLVLFLDITVRSIFETLLEKIMPKGQMEKSMPKAQIEKSMPKGQMEKSMPQAQIEKSMSKGHMEKSMPKGHMENKLDYNPFPFDLSTTGKNSF